MGRQRLLVGELVRQVIPAATGALRERMVTRQVAWLVQQERLDQLAAVAAGTRALPWAAGPEGRRQVVGPPVLAMAADWAQATSCALWQLVTALVLEVRTGVAVFRLLGSGRASRAAEAGGRLLPVAVCARRW